MATPTTTDQPLQLLTLQLPNARGHLMQVWSIEFDRKRRQVLFTGQADVTVYPGTHTPAFVESTITGSCYDATASDRA